MTRRTFRTNPTRAGAAMAAATATFWSAGALAQHMAANSLVDLDLEQLANVQVISATKRPQRLAEVAGSLYVITADDIRRSGAASLPEVLRLAPNLNVARADANQYAISARGFSGVLANKMLVLVDGRTVYSPLFSGVFWESQDVLLEDVERIEVLSGSAGTLWGSNAVNGVINVVTRNAADTHGALLTATAGSEDKVLGARWGAAAGDVHWRAYAKRVLRDHQELTSGAPIRDASERSQAGFRADSSAGGYSLTVQGDVYETDIDQAPSARRAAGMNLLARYVRQTAKGRLQAQAYWDRAERRQPGAIDDRLDTVDIEVQQQLQPRTGHELLLGGGWRTQDDSLDNLTPAVLRFVPADRKLHLWNLFAQDEIALGESMRVTAGLKAEHNPYTGLEYLPSLRWAWQATPSHLVWASAARAVRTPSRIDREVSTTVLRAGTSFVSEVARVYEVGVRGQPHPRLSYSATLFHHQFDRLRSVDFFAPPATVTFNNNYRGELTGFEGWAQWRPMDRWRLQAGYTNQKLRASALPGTAPVEPVSSLGNDPRYRITFGSSWDVGAAMEFDVHARRSGSLPAPYVPAYTAVDLRWGWRPRADLELSLAVRNATDRGHPEWGAPANRAEFARSVLLKAVWRL